MLLASEIDNVVDHGCALESPFGRSCVQAAPLFRFLLRTSQQHQQHHQIHSQLRTSVLYERPRIHRNANWRRSGPSGSSMDHGSIPSGANGPRTAVCCQRRVDQGGHDYGWSGACARQAKTPVVTTAGGHSYAIGKFLRGQSTATCVAPGRRGRGRGRRISPAARRQAAVPYEQHRTTTALLD